MMASILVHAGSLPLGTNLLMENELTAEPPVGPGPPPVRQATVASMMDMKAACCHFIGGSPVRVAW